MYKDAQEMPCYVCKATRRAEPARDCRLCGGTGRIFSNTSPEEMTKRSTVRAHHVIPRWYQKRFANNRGTLFFCHKHKGRVGETGPNALFVKKDAYQVRDGRIVMADCEHEFAVLDTENDKMVRELLGQIMESEQRGHMNIDLQRNPLEILASNLLVRNPSLFNGSIARVSAKEKDRANGKDQAAIDRSVKIAMTGVVIGMSQDPLSFLRTTRIGIGRTPRGEQLIIGNHLMPNLRINNCRVFGLPLNSTTIVLWEHDHRDDNRRVQPAIAPQSPIVKLSRYNTRAFNRGVLEGSTTIAGPNRSTIEAMVTAYRRRHQPPSGAD